MGKFDKKANKHEKIEKKPRKTKVANLSHKDAKSERDSALKLLDRMKRGAKASVDSSKMAKKEIAGDE